MKTPLCLLFLALPTASQAQTIQTAPGKTLATREQYTACLDSADQARARQDALQKRRADYDAAVQKLQVELKAHMDAHDTIKPGSRRADAWNNTSAQLNTRTTALSDEANAIEKGIAEHNRLTDEARTRCSNLQVIPADRAAVEAQRQKKP